MITLPSVEHDATYSPEWSLGKKTKKVEKANLNFYLTVKILISLFNSVIAFLITQPLFYNTNL